MERLVQVVLRGARVELGPQELHRAVALQPPSRLEREHLHQGSRLAQPPGALLHLDAVDDDGEASEQRDGD
jgi:hypothetical protein